MGSKGRNSTFAGIVVDWNAARCDISILRRVGHVAERHTVREAIADLEFSHLDG
jgi:hypothetical protein